MVFWKVIKKEKGIYGYNNDIVIDGYAIIKRHIEQGNWWEDAFPINFCPACGKKISDAAKVAASTQE